MDSTTTKFVALYDGPAHENHEIDIITLGHSLTALGALLYETNDVLNGERSSIDVRINAEFIEGSFGFEVEIIQSLVNAKDILVPLGLLGGAAATGTVIGAINWLKGEEIIAVESDDDSVEAQIYVNGDAVNCPKDVAALVSNPRIRNALEDIVRAPLMDEGTATIAFKKDKHDDSPALQIDKAQAESFTRLSLAKTSEDDYTTERVTFIAANIKKKTGWQIELNGQAFTVKMEDQAFRERLLNMEESYVFGRRFEVTLKTVISRTVAKSTTTRYITHVKNEVIQK